MASPQSERSWVILDFNDKDQVVGVEILNVQKRVPEASLKEMKFEVA